MNICFIAIDYHQQASGGGIATYIDTLSKELVRQGHTIIILVKTPSKPTQHIELKEENPKVYFVSLGNIHYYLHKVPFLGKRISGTIRQIEWSYGIWVALRSIARRQRLDMIEGQEVGNLFITLFFKKIPLIVRAHGATYSQRKFSGEKIYLGDRINRYIERWCIRKAAAITVPSEFQKREICSETGLPPQRVRVVSNPISPDILRKSHKTTVFEKETQPIVLYTGRIEYRKGIIPLLKCISQVIRKQSNVKFVLAGGYHVSLTDRTVRKIIQEEAIAEYVQLKGHVPWEKLVDLYKTSSIFVIPSYYETFSISCIEAMAFDLPVVGAKGSALPELIEDEVTGLLIPPGNSQALATAILRLLKDKDLRQRMGQAGRQRVLSKFTVAQVVKQTLALYKKVIG